MKVLSLALMVVLLPIVAGATTLSNGVSSVNTTSAVFSVGVTATNSLPTGNTLPAIDLVYGRANKGSSYDDWQYKVSLGKPAGLNSNITYTVYNLERARGYFFAFRTTENAGTNYEWTTITALTSSNIIRVTPSVTTHLDVNTSGQITTGPGTNLTVKTVTATNAIIGGVTLNASVLASNLQINVLVPGGGTNALFFSNGVYRARSVVP